MADILQDRLDAVRQRVRDACRRVGRTDDVTIVAVTKTVSIDTAARIFQLGIRDLAENRPQELWKKQAAIPEANWHFIGHLQRNKLEKTVPLASRIHSIDSLRLLQAVDEFALKTGGKVPVLLEVNCSREPNKGGFNPDELPPLTWQGVAIEGLMTMAAIDGDPRGTFAELRRLRDEIRSKTSLELPHLSMGMSGDFEVAIEEGATLIRLGTVLFEGLS